MTYNKLLMHIQDLFKIEDIFSSFDNGNKRIVSKLHADGYSYQDIYNAIEFYLKVRKGDFKKMNGRIGIIPYIIEDSKKYWVNQTNKKLKVAEDFKAVNYEKRDPISVRNTDESKNKKEIDINTL